MYITVVTQ